MAEPDARPPATSYSTADVARRLGVSIPTVQRWVDSGHLLAWKTVGGHRRIDARSADAFIRAHGHAHDDDDAAATAATAATATASSSAGAAPVGQPPAVLVVDDNPDDRDVLVALVEMALPGAAIHVARNGFEALMALGRALPQLVVTDLSMPHMDGFEMIRHLAAKFDGAGPLILAVSAVDPASLAGREPLPADVRFLPKPVEPDRFVALVRTALNTHPTD